MTRHEQNKRDQKKIRDAVDALMPFFDSVQVVATRLDPANGATESYHVGDGNWYTRFGSVKEWIVKEEARIQTAAAADAFGDEDEDEDQLPPDCKSADDNG